VGPLSQPREPVFIPLAPPRFFRLVTGPLTSMRRIMDAREPLFHDPHDLVLSVVVFILPCESVVFEVVLAD
jgi:hypothetical protein